MEMKYSISLLRKDDSEYFLAHSRRLESSNGPVLKDIFSPHEEYLDIFDERLKDVINNQLLKLITESKWKRIWCLWANRQIVGHVDLYGGDIKPEMHRATLGIGIEPEYQNKGFGRKLMDAALEFAEIADGLDIIELNVFSHNHRAIRLYERLGFELCGKVADRVRVFGYRIDDLTYQKSVRRK